MDGRRDEQDADLPSGDEAIERGNQEARKALDDVPPPGTDPLHEGP
ncbi:MAG: hypothetical protein JOZ90_14900 [Alphaproteobacteria bacterium]|nr:hypothetical protein [Alphaproteobacteria bacterium]MBV9371425.1 hypothetical protein [Alphaproteobacteria bacterium]MBV9902362.1 hypothetical protein [Alphaproteobacteria bacterium]